MDTVSTVRYVKSGKFWRVSNSIFKSPLLFFGMCQQLWPEEEVRPTTKIPITKKILDIFSDNAFLSRGIWTTGQGEKEAVILNNPGYGHIYWNRAPDKGTERVNVVTNEVWTE